MDNERPLGGKTILFISDWRQVGPVVPYGTQTEGTEQAFISSHLWNHVHRLRLTVSMRDKNDLPHAKTVLAVGEGAIAPVALAEGNHGSPLQPTITQDDGTVTTCTIANTTDFKQLVQAVYPDLWTVNHNIYNDRGILAPTNDNIDQTNDYILSRLPGDIHHRLSSDKIASDDKEMPDVVPVEFLNTVQVPGFPPHYLHLKLGVLIISSEILTSTADW